MFLRHFIQAQQQQQRPQAMQAKPVPRPLSNYREEFQPTAATYRYVTDHKSRFAARAAEVEDKAKPPRQFGFQQLEKNACPRYRPTSPLNYDTEQTDDGGDLESMMSELNLEHNNSDVESIFFNGRNEFIADSIDDLTNGRDMMRQVANRVDNAISKLKIHEKKEHHGRATEIKAESKPKESGASDRIKPEVLKSIEDIKTECYKRIESSMATLKTIDTFTHNLLIQKDKK